MHKKKAEKQKSFSAFYHVIAARRFEWPLVLDLVNVERQLYRYQSLCLWFLQNSCFIECVSEIRLIREGLVDDTEAQVAFN